MTKSKSSTIAIVALSVLLAAALAATIVLAAFSASKQASTTITFASGVEIEVTGISDSPIHDTTYAWKATVAGQNENATGSIELASKNVTLTPFTIKNSSTADNSQIFIIAKPVVLKKGAGELGADSDVTTTYVTMTEGKWTPIKTADGQKNTGWYLYGTSDGSGADIVYTGTQVAKNGVAADVLTTAIVADDNAGAEFTATLSIFAASATDTISGLADVLAEARKA